VAYPSTGRSLETVLQNRTPQREEGEGGGQGLALLPHRETVGTEGKRWHRVGRTVGCRLAT
jgi:hypothetical protein